MLSKQMYNKSDCSKVLTVIQRAKWLEVEGGHKDVVLELTICINKGGFPSVCFACDAAHTPLRGEPLKCGVKCMGGAVNV